MAEQLANNAASTLSGAITFSATSLVVASAAQFPATGDFRILIGSELLLVTAVAGTTFTVTRAIESTSAAAHSNGDAVTHILTAGSLIAAITDRIAAITPSGLVLLESHTAAASASLAFTTRNAPGQSGNSFQTDYDDYLFRFINVRPTVANQPFLTEFSINSGAAWVTAANYYWEWTYGANTTGNGILVGNAVSEITLFTGIDTGFTTGLSGKLDLFDPLTSNEKNCVFDVFARQAGALFRGQGVGYYAVNLAANAQKFYYAGGVASGTIRLYGYAK